MVKKKAVKTLKEQCIGTIPVAVVSHIRRLVYRSCAASQWFHLMSGGEHSDDEDALLQQQVECLRNHLESCTIWYDYEAVFLALLTAVNEAITITRQSWKPSSNMPQYRREVDAISAFAGVAVFPHLRHLEFSTVPTALRTRLLETLPSFTDLRALSLDCDGQWMFKSNMDRLVLEALPALRRLERFSMKHSCNCRVLEALASSSCDTLTTLDVEGSKNVGDSCLEALVSFERIEELNVFNTGLGEEALAKVLLATPNLSKLVRGDFLCEALDWIDHWSSLLPSETGEESSAPIGDPASQRPLKIREFFPSQKYFFHEDWQMELVAKMCPWMSKVLFIFHEAYASDFMVLAPFRNLQILELFGGAFFENRVAELLELQGARLLKLKLISVQGIDFKALALISIYCRNLRKLAFHNCHFQGNEPYSRGVNLNRPAEQAELLRREAFDIVQPFSNLRAISLVSTCGKAHLSFLLGRCPGIRRIHLGTQTSMCDETLGRIFAQNPLFDLEEFYCEHSGQDAGLTMASVELLINSCPQLRLLADLQGWTALTGADIGHLRKLVHDQNLDLDLRGNQKARKFLQMRDFERRTYLNLMAGPSIERVRLLGQQR